MLEDPLDDVALDSSGCCAKVGASADARDPSAIQAVEVKMQCRIRGVGAHS